MWKKDKYPAIELCQDTGLKKYFVSQRQISVWQLVMPILVIFIDRGLFLLVCYR